MRLKLFAVGLSFVAFADAARAATIIVYTDPMTFDRRTVVIDTPGPDRAFLCMAPPSNSGCVAIPVKRGR